MRLRLVFSLLAALAAVLAAESPARSAHLLSGCADQCADQCNVRVRYKTCYQTVVEEQTRTCYKMVPKTIMKECKYTVCKPVYKTVEKEVCEIVCQPVWKEQEVKVCVNEWKEEKVWVPGKVITKRVQLPACPPAGDGCADDCGCKPHLLHRLFHRDCANGGQEVCLQIQCPGQWVCKRVCVPREEIQKVKVCEMQRQEVRKKVQVQVCEMVREEVCKQVPVTICERVPVCVTEKVCKRVKTCVPVCEVERPHLLSRLLSHLHCKRGCECPEPCHGDGAVITTAPHPARELAPAPKPK